VSADATDPDETNNIATVTTTVQAAADLRIVKSALKDELCLGAYNVYEIEVANMDRRMRKRCTSPTC